MKTLKRQFRMILSLWFITLSLVSQGQSTDQTPTPLETEKHYEIGTYVGANRTVNLMVVVRQMPGVTIRIKGVDNEILHELVIKKSPRAYHYKLNFEGSQSGLYKLEINDGQKSQTRWIEVVDIPATQAQRYVTFSSPIAQ